MTRMQRCAQLLAVDGQFRYKRILRVMDGPAAQARPTGWWSVPPNVAPDTHYWDSHVQAPVAYPPRPSVDWKFEFSALAWKPDHDALWAKVRRDRAALLTACDWRILPDAPTLPADRPAWLTYRQALRDITESGDPAAIVWPTPPG